MAQLPADGEMITEYGVLMSGGGVHVRNQAAYVEDIYPLADWLEGQKREGATVLRRKVIVVEDWDEVARDG